MKFKEVIHSYFYFKKIFKMPFLFFFYIYLILDIIMFEMFIILPFFGILCLFSYIFSKIFWRDYNQLNFIKYTIGIVGVIIHELSHLIAAIICGLRPKGFGIRLRSPATGQISPNGYVSLSVKGKSLLQSFICSLAPLFVGTWLFLNLIPVILSSEYDILIRILAGFICISLLFGMNPSKADLRLIKLTYLNDVRYSWYQIFLIVLSGFLIWAILFVFQINLLLDLFYYLLVGLCYYFIKYSFKGINILYYAITQKNTKHFNYKNYTRQHFKPTNPKKLGIERAHW